VFSKKDSVITELVCVVLAQSYFASMLKLRTIANAVSFVLIDFASLIVDNNLLTI